METVDCLVVGAGVVGLAVAERLSRRRADVIVVERHDGFGRETSSRNSEVIHAGLYYPKNSLKAVLCVKGRRMLYELCAKAGIPHRKTGKLVVANHPEEQEKIHQVLRQGTENGVEGLALLSQCQVEKLEPRVKAREAVLSPETGIVDTHLLMKYLEQTAETNGATVAYNCEARAIAKCGGGYEVEMRDADGGSMTVRCGIVVNAAGLAADDIAAMAGIDIDAAGYRIHPCKGEYVAVAGRHKGALSHLVYPAPTPISLGIHAVLGIDGSLRLGPNAFYVESTTDYDVDPGHLREFLDGGREYLPFIEEQDLRPEQAGIRPKLQRENEGFRDFVITDESSRGLPGLINLVGIESPGLTACLAIAEMVAVLVGD